ncbi:unnamed protein product [Urochloa humidicola]
MSSEVGSERAPEAGGGGGHVLLLPYTTQGHVHPFLQFGKRLAFHGLRPTLAVTRFLLASRRAKAGEEGAVRIAAFSDGCDRRGFAELNDATAYHARLEATGSQTLGELMDAEAAAGRPIRAVIYDVFLPWAQGVARQHGAAAVAFFTTPCAVNLVYGHEWCKRVGAPVGARDRVQLPGLPTLEPEDLPWFFKLGPRPYPAYYEMVMSQFMGLEHADDVLVNSVYELEPQEAAYMESEWRGKTVGPTVPASYLDDDRFPPDTNYGFHLFQLNAAPCMEWLDAQAPRSVVFAAFGSLSNLDPSEMCAVAQGLVDAGRPFLWVVRSSETHKLPAGYDEACGTRGMVVPWCPQMEVLVHRAVGCFLTHCGWNSVLEAMVAGLPMVALPQWTDQPTNAKYVQDVWRAGVRVRPAAVQGPVLREDVARAIKEVMDSEKIGDYRRNVLVCKQKLTAASREGGSSDRNIADFVAKYSA